MSANRDPELTFLTVWSPPCGWPVRGVLKTPPVHAKGLRRRVTPTRRAENPECVAHQPSWPRAAPVEETAPIRFGSVPSPHPHQSPDEWISVQVLALASVLLPFRAMPFALPTADVPTSLFEAALGLLDREDRSAADRLAEAAAQMLARHLVDSYIAVPL